MAMNLWELQRDPNWKDAASSTGGITQSSVNYLRYLMNGSRLLKNARRKTEQLCDLLYI